MIGHSIQNLHNFAVPITWGNNNHWVIHDEVKNTEFYETAYKLNTVNKNSFVPVLYIFAFSTSWLHSALHSALLLQQTCFLQNKGSPVIRVHIHTEHGNTWT